MRKILFVLVGIILLGGSVQAQSQTDKLMAKVKTQQRIELKDIPVGYSWCDKLALQSDKNIFYAAKKIYEQNPQSFNAVFNYGVLIYYTVVPEEGLYVSAVRLDEAYKVLEQAKALRPNEVEVYNNQIELLEYKLFGNEVPFPLEDEKKLDRLAKAPDVARKLLALLERKFALLEITEQTTLQDDALSYAAYEAYLICKSLNRTKAATYWFELAKRLQDARYNYIIEAIYQRELSKLLA